MTNKTTNKRKSTTPPIIDAIPTRHTPMVAVLEALTSNAADRDSDVVNIAQHIRTILADKLKLHHFIGIQPMVAPVGLIYALVCTQQSSDTNSLELIPKPIEARMWKLSTKVNYPNEYTDELLQAHATELCTEMHNEYMDLMYRVSTVVDFRLDLGENPDVMLAKLMEGSKEIGRMSRRGRGNRMILPYEVYCLLIPSLMARGFVQHQGERELTDILFCGIIDGVEIYTSIRNTVVLIGYKGCTGETDCGIFHAPFQLEVTQGETSVDGDSTISTHYRYGQRVMPTACHYYVSIQVR